MDKTIPKMLHHHSNNKEPIEVLQRMYKPFDQCFLDHRNVIYSIFKIKNKKRNKKLPYNNQLSIEKILAQI